MLFPIDNDRTESKHRPNYTVTWRLWKLLFWAVAAGVSPAFSACFRVDRVETRKREQGHGMNKMKKRSCVPDIKQAVTFNC
jgi:hypothetical protein